MDPYQLRKAVAHEELDYVFLKNCLAGYANPRDKITRLLRSGSLIRVKKGLYVFGPDLAQQPYAMEALANRVYGPSAVSLQYALWFYSLVPERGETVTSITNKRDKEFNTPVGRFTYKYVHPGYFPVGITMNWLDDAHPVLMATKEKALADVLAFGPGTPHLDRVPELEEFLFDDLRVDPQELSVINRKRLLRVATVYKSRNVDLLAKLVSRKARTT